MYVTRALTHALVRVLNNAYGDRGLAPPRHTRSQARFVWTRKATLREDRRERERSGPASTNSSAREERERVRKSVYIRENRARDSIERRAPP